MRHLGGGLEQNQAAAGVDAIDPPAVGRGHELLPVGCWVLPPQREKEATLAIEVAVAGAGVAAPLGKHRHHITVEGDRRCRLLDGRLVSPRGFRQQKQPEQHCRRGPQGCGGCCELRPPWGRPTNWGPLANGRVLDGHHGDQLSGAARGSQTLCRSFLGYLTCRWQAQHPLAAESRSAGQLRDRLAPRCEQHGTAGEVGHA